MHKPARKQGRYAQCGVTKTADVLNVEHIALAYARACASCSNRIMTPGYSGKPLSKKLGITPGMIVVTVNAPDNYSDLLMHVPEDVLIIDADTRSSARAKSSSQPIDLIHFFT